MIGFIWRCCKTRRRASVLDRWQRLVRHFLRLRRLQRLFGYLGQHLQRYPAGLRLRLRQTWPAPGSGASR
eukprot:10173447-Heterocapsa_arctica.AAC.1